MMMQGVRCRTGIVSHASHRGTSESRGERLLFLALMTPWFPLVRVLIFLWPNDALFFLLSLPTKASSYCVSLALQLSMGKTKPFLKRGKGSNESSPVNY